MDFANNVWCGFKVFRRASRKDWGQLADCREILQIMVLNEVMELILPLGYIMCFLTAWYGRNPHAFGTVRGSPEAGFYLPPTDEVWPMILKLLILASIDLVSILITGLMLWYGCTISVWQTFLYLMREYGLFLNTVLPIAIGAYFCTMMGACGIDLSFRFGWL